MWIFFSMVIICVVVCAIYMICVSANSEIGAKEQRIYRYKESLKGYTDNLKNLEEEVTYTVKKFFSMEENPSDYEAACDSIDNIMDSMKKCVVKMREINGRLIYESRNENQIDLISQAESQAIDYAADVAERLQGYGKEVYTLPLSRMMDAFYYGQINKNYLDAVNKMQRNFAVSYIITCEEILNSTAIDKVFTIDIEGVLKCIWFFAMEKTFSATDFQKAKRVFLRIYKYSHVDIIIADLYAKKKMGGEDVLREPVRNLLKDDKQNSWELTLIASGLMWMHAYQSENTVLQHMLATGKEMTLKTQERLHSLSNGGGKAPDGFDVQSSYNSLYFDVSSLAWKESEYIGLFENLAFQDKTLTYSLAVRDENRDLFIAQEINVPGIKDILNKFKSVFDEEYGSNVMIRATNGIALSGSGQEKIEGILVYSNECKQMGILLYIAKIGKKFIIKFYTLFMPDGFDLALQRQQALSLYKKLSPSVTMWESSLKDTMLRTVEQLLNTRVKSAGVEDSSISESYDTVSDKPVF